MAGSGHLQNPDSQEDRGQWKVEPHQNLTSAESPSADRLRPTTINAHAGYIIHVYSQPWGLRLVEAAEKEG